MKRPRPAQRGVNHEVGGGCGAVRPEHYDWGLVAKREEVKFDGSEVHSIVCE